MWTTTGKMGLGIDMDAQTFVAFGFMGNGGVYDAWLTLDEGGAGNQGTVRIGPDLIVAGRISSMGGKNALQKTQHYGGRYINAYETAEYYFGDIGEGIIKDGTCRINIEPIFGECVNTGMPYQVFLSPYGEGQIYVSERNKEYFMVRGANIGFTWEIKAKRRGYEQDRLEEGVIPDDTLYSSRAPDPAA